MENHETVLSEVHLGLSASSKATNVVSRFEFVIPCPSPEPTGSSNENVTSDTIADQTPQVYHNRETSVHEKNCSENLSGKVEVVEEHFAPEELKRTSGDQSPPRRNRPREVLFIEHHMATPLAAVGLQVWPAALLMADFIIHERSRWRNRTVLEVGGGVGLCGIVAALFAQRTICTDHLTEVVQLMGRNFQRNSSLLRGNYECRVLDVQLPSSEQSSSGTALDEIPNCDVVFASDVIYSGAITEALLTFVKRLLQRTSGAPDEFFLALERRLNFTTEALAVSCPAYDYFVELCLQLQLSRELLDVTQIPAYFQYERSMYLELHRLTLKPNAELTRDPAT